MYQLRNEEKLEVVPDLSTGDASMFYSSYTQGCSKYDDLVIVLQSSYNSSDEQDRILT